MKKKNRKKRIITALLLVVIIIAVFLLQSIFMPAIGLTLPIFLLIPLTAAIAMYEKDYTGMCFGIFAGVLTDMSSGIPDGIYTLLFAIFAFVTGYLSRRFFRNTATVSWLMSLAGCILLYAVSLIANYFSGYAGSVNRVIISIYIPAFIITLLISPIAYPIIRQVEKIKNEAY